MRLNIYGLQPIIAPRDPLLPMEVATKNYVDNLMSDHIEDLSLHLSPEQKDLLDNLDIGSDALNSLEGIKGNVQDQLDSKLDLAGGSMEGPITLSGKPEEPLHAASKSYVDQERDTRVAKAGDTMTGHLVLHDVPVANMHAAPKEYVDTTVSEHANNFNLHITPAQNTWLDAIDVTASEVNRLDGVTSNIQQQIDSKFDKAGGEVTGDVTLAEGKAVFVSKVPEGSTELVNKAYVDALVNGLEWKDPITDGNVLGIGVNTIPTDPEYRATYISGSSPESPWAAHYAYTFDGENWVALQGRAVQAGDRFAIGFDFKEENLDSSLNGHFGELITITGIEAGELVYTTEQLTPGSTTLVFDEESTRFGVSYSLSDEGKWVPTNTSANLTAGDGLHLEGNTLNIVVGNGIKIEDNKVKAKIKSGSVIKVDGDGIDLPFNGQHFEISDTLKLELAEEVLADIDDKLSMTDGGTITGGVVFDTNSSLEIGYTPSKNSHAVTKQYVDGITGDLQDSVDGLDGRLDVLEEDPVTKTFVVAELGKKVNKAGDEMTGPLTLHGAPTANNHAATKKYADDILDLHKDDFDLHLTEAQNTWIDAITVTSTEVNHLVGVTDNVQDQIDSKLNLSGGTLTGPLELAGNPQSDLEAATKQYVDAVDDAKVAKAGDTMTGALVLHANPTADLHAATKQYVDGLIEDLDTDMETELAKKVDKAGDTMTGHLTLNADPQASLHAATKNYVDSEVLDLGNRLDSDIKDLQDDMEAVEGRLDVLELDPVTKQYVDDELALKLDLAGGSMSGYITLHSDPTQAMHAVNKQYVDAVAQGLRVKAAVRYATSENLAANYNNGSHGVDSTLTASSNGTLIVDGRTVEAGDRILVKSQTNKAHNGDYVVQQAGNASTPFILKRTTTVDESHEVHSSYFFVYDGDELKGTGWTFTTDNPGTFAIGTNDIHVNQFSGQGTVIAGDGLELDGNTLNVITASPNRIKVTGTDIDLATTGVTPGTYTKLEVDAYGRVMSATKPNSYTDLGLTDVQPLNSKLTSISNTEGNGLLVIDTNGNAKFRELEVDGVGLSVSNPLGNSGNMKISSNATPSATAETVVSRDEEGNFSANVITASLDGNAATATKLKDSRDFDIESSEIEAEAVSFDGTGDVTLVAQLKETGVTVGEYTLLTVDSKGRVTEASKPTEIADLGIEDVPTYDELQERVDELEEKFQELYLFVMSRI